MELDYKMKGPIKIASIQLQKTNTIIKPTTSYLHIEVKKCCVLIEIFQLNYFQYYGNIECLLF